MKLEDYKKRKIEKQIMIKMKDEGKTYEEIGRLFNISRQRVQQILRAPRIIVKDSILRANGKCEACGQILIGKIESHHISYKKNEILRVCTSCHRKIHACSIRLVT
jgi:hypothetical protein